MLKKFLFTVCLGITTMIAAAQQPEEPEFIGEAMILRKDNTTTPLEKQLAQTRRAASTGLILTGIGKYRKQLQINGCCAKVNIDKDEDVKFIVRNYDNESDPISVVQIFKFESKRDIRRAELASISSFGSVKDNNLLYVPFTGRKYGTSSYSLTVSGLTPGQYGIIVLNPNALDEKQTVVSTFGVR